MITEPKFAAELWPEVSETVRDEVDMEKSREKTDKLISPRSHRVSPHDMKTFYLPASNRL